MIDFGNISHDTLTAWIFWLELVIVALLVVDIYVHLRDML